MERVFFFSLFQKVWSAGFLGCCSLILLFSTFCRLQAVMCIISTIMESCPSTSSFYSTATAKTQHNGMNNIIRLFLKKGLVNDLARVPHSLDLSRCAALLHMLVLFVYC